jgi:hypothetical protein
MIFIRRSSFVARHLSGFIRSIRKIRVRFFGKWDSNRVDLKTEGKPLRVTLARLT